MSVARPRTRSLYDAPNERLEEILSLAEHRVSWVLEHAQEKTLLELLAMAYVQGIDDAAATSEEKHA